VPKTVSAREVKSKNVVAWIRAGKKPETEEDKEIF